MRPNVNTMACRRKVAGENTIALRDGGEVRRHFTGGQVE